MVALIPYAIPTLAVKSKIISDIKEAFTEAFTPPPKKNTPPPKKKMIPLVEINKNIAEIKTRSADTETQDIRLLSSDENVDAIRADIETLKLYAQTLKLMHNAQYKEVDDLANALTLRVDEINRKRADQDNQHWWDHKWIPLWCSGPECHGGYTEKNYDPGKGAGYVATFAKERIEAKKEFETLKNHNPNAQDLQSLAADIDKMRALTPHLLDKAITFLKEREPRIKELTKQEFNNIQVRNAKPQKETILESLQALEDDKKRVNALDTYNHDGAQQTLSFLDAVAKQMVDRELEIIKARNKNPQNPNDVIASLKAINADKALIDHMRKYSNEKANENRQYLETQGTAIADQAIGAINIRYANKPIEPKENIGAIQKNIKQLEEIRDAGYPQANELLNLLTKRVEDIGTARISTYAEHPEE